MALNGALERYNFAMTEDVLRRVAHLMTKSAVSIKNEDPQTANHAKRTIFADRVLVNPRGSSFQMSIAVWTDTNLDDTATDAAIETAINARWDAFSGV